MAFPYLYDETFDDGTLGGFDSETDASAILDYPHYADLARQGLHPWQGAHAMRARLAGTAVGYVTETAGFDTAAAGTIFVWFSVLIGAELSLTASDAVILFTLDSAGPVTEAVVGVRNNGGVYELYCTDTATTRTLAIVPNNKRWYQIEIKCLIDNAGADNGTIDFYVDGAPVGAQITGCDQAAITQARFGAVSGTAALNRGTILFGAIVADDLRIYPRQRFTQDTTWITRDRVAWLGPCVIDSAVVTGTSTDAVMTILDTDIYEATGITFSRSPAVYLRNVTANDQSPGFNTPIELQKGAYVILTGTSPQGWVSIRRESDVVASSANYVDRGLQRSPLI